MQDEQNGNPSPQEQKELNALQKVKSAQTLITAATIAAPVSLIFGGVLLSSLALVCGVVGYRRLSGVETSRVQDSNAVEAAKKSARMALVMCGVALALNAVSMAVFLQSGGMGIIDGAGATQSPEATPSPSVWG